MEQGEASFPGPKMPSRSARCLGIRAVIVAIVALLLFAAAKVPNRRRSYP
jgi:hypothetical protein